eukprot:961443_1
MMALMISLNVVIALINSLFLISCVWSQTTICVWNSADPWDHINGEYTKHIDLWNTFPYWQSVSNSCDTSSYIFASLYAPDSQYYWLIHPTLVTDYVIAFPDCEAAFVGGTNTNPTICSNGWYEWYSSANSIKLPLTVTSGSCPSLQCGAIQVEGITTVDHTLCNQIFERNTQQRNVFVEAAKQFTVHNNRKSDHKMNSKKSGP